LFVTIRSIHQALTLFDTRCWRSPYTRIGFGVTLIHSTNNSSSSNSEAAQYNETDLGLRDGEKMKFAKRTGSMNPIPITNKTLSADEVIGEILLDANNVFIPIAAGPLVNLGAYSEGSMKHTRGYHYVPGDCYDSPLLPTWQTTSTLLLPKSNIVDLIELKED
jgi:hypothetical protein